MGRTGSRTLRIGITGGIGSGKSTVCKTFERLGLPVVYADALAKHISERQPAVRKSLSSLLGPYAFGPDGSLNRAYVARRLFSNDRIRRRINAIIHPRVITEVKRIIRQYHRRGRRVVLVEAALIFESDFDRHLDFVVLVDAPVKIRLERIQRRDKTSAAEVRRRMKAQWPSARKRALSHFVIDNTGSKAQVARQVRFLAKLFRSLTR